MTSLILLYHIHGELEVIWVILGTCGNDGFTIEFPMILGASLCPSSDVTSIYNPPVTSCICHGQLDIPTKFASLWLVYFLKKIVFHVSALESLKKLEDFRAKAAIIK